MRILHAVQELEPGGAERIVLALASGARRAGHEVAVAAAPGPLQEELDADVFPMPLVRRRPWRVAPAALSLRRVMKSWRPDLLHSHNPGMALAASLATQRGRAIPAFSTFHGVSGEHYDAAARALRYAGLPVVACGPGVEHGLAERSVRPLTTIVNGIPPAPAPADRAELEAALGIAANRPLVVSAGRLVPQKHHALAIQAFAEVPDATLLVLGKGPLQPQLERQVRELGLDERVVISGFRPDARAIVGAADVFVLSSDWEGLPLVALEALAVGTPVVATKVQGIRELLADGATALLTPPGDAAALAAALTRVLHDSVLADRLARAGRELAAGYTEEAMTSRYLALYERIVENRRR